MTEMFQGLLDQFSSVLDVSMVQPVFGVKNAFWLFVIIEVIVRFYLGSGSRQLREKDTEQHKDLVRHYWIKIGVLFLFLRPLFMAASPEDGRFNALLVNELINIVLIGSVFLRLRYVHAEDARFEEWTELDAQEGATGDEKS